MINGYSLFNVIITPGHGTAIPSARSTRGDNVTFNACAAITLLVASMLAQQTGAGAAETIGTVTQVYDGTLTSDVQVHTFRHIDRLFPVRVVKHGPNVLALPRAAKPLTKVEFSSAAKSYDLIDYMALNRVTALLVLKDGKIAFEDYEMGNTEKTRWMSMSMVKSITSSLMGAAIQEAHAHKLKLTGHLCSVTWPEAVALGIDDLEHGPVFADTEFVADKRPDVCPTAGAESWAKQDVNGGQVQELIRKLVSHHVAVTSTLPVFESSAPGRPKLQRRSLDAMSAESAQSYLTARANVPLDSPMTALLRKEMDFEVAFAKAGGLLLAGPDPTGNGGVLPGFGDQREIELLVEAGFTPVEAIHTATENGAVYLGQQDRIGTLSPGKRADLVVIKGDPSKRIEEIENVEIVFKAGIGYDSKKLIESVRGQVGIR